MFKRISRNLTFYKAKQHEFAHGEPIDPHQFEDPLALRTDWTPISKTSGFRRQRFVHAGPDVFRSQPTLASVLFGFLFAIPLGGLALILLVVFLLCLSNASNFPGALWFLFFGLLVAGPGFIPLYFTYKPVVFNKVNGHFRTGYQVPLLAKFTTEAFPLECIHAVQAIKGKWSSSGNSGKRSHRSTPLHYEFNLVSENGSRLNLLSHSNAEAIKTEARQLSEFLEIPLWDAIPDWMTGDSPPPS